MAQSAGIVCADRGLIAPAVALLSAATAVALGVVAARRTSPRLALAVVAAFFAGAHALGSRLDAAERYRPSVSREVELEGTVRAVSVSPGGWRVDLAHTAPLGGERAPAAVRVFGTPPASGGGSLEAALPGERIRARLRLAPPRDARNPGARDDPRRLARRGIGAVGRLVHPALHVRVARGDASLRVRLEARRFAAGEGLSSLGRGGGLLRALALGDPRGLTPDERAAFARLGLAHLLAVSGLHLSLLAGAAYLLARALLRRSAALAARWDTRLGALLAGLAAAALYAVVAGWGIPVRRALVLLVALALAVARSRPRAGAPPLAAAASILLAFEPASLFEPGAQLSYAASAALALTFRAGFRIGRAEAVLRAGATATAATTPFAAWHFGVAAPLAVVANLVAVPWTGAVLLPAALTAAGIQLLPEDLRPEPALALAEWVASETLTAVAALGDLVPGASSGARPATAWLVTAGGVVVLALRARGTSRRALFAVVASGLLAIAPPKPLRPAPPRVALLDVGQGDAALVQGRRGSVLIDAGTALPGGFDLGRRRVLPALRALGVRRLDLAVVSHGDLDHRGGMPAVLEALPVGALWLPYGAFGDPAFESLRAAAAARGVAVRERGRGSPPEWAGDLRVAPLWPPAGGRASRNDRSLVVRIAAGGRSVLFAGDLERGGEEALVAAGPDLRADVLKLGHHGSRTSSMRVFLAAVGPDVVVASAPCGGRFGMPHADAVRRAREAGASLWWTGRDGAVLIGLSERLTVWGHGARPACSFTGSSALWHHAPPNGDATGAGRGGRQRRRAGVRRREGDRGQPRGAAERPRESRASLGDRRRG